MPARARPSFDFTSTSPYHGSVGEILRITFKTHFEYNPAKHTFHVDFGGKFKVRARLRNEFFQEPFHHFVLEAEVPNFQGDHLTMPLLIDLQDENALTLEHKNAGEFFYSSAGYHAYASDTRKRKFPEETSDFSLPTAKRSASQPLRLAHFKDSLLDG